MYFIFNMILPAVASIDDLYGQMIRGRFNKATFGADTMVVVEKLTSATIELWRLTKAKMLPTPAKFHYIFNMRELSRVFQGILMTPRDSIITGGQQTPTRDGATMLLRLWKHECLRVFQVRPAVLHPCPAPCALLRYDRAWRCRTDCCYRTSWRPRTTSSGSTTPWSACVSRTSARTPARRRGTRPTSSTSSATTSTMTTTCSRTTAPRSTRRVATCPGSRRAWRCT